MDLMKLIQKYVFYISEGVTLYLLLASLLSKSYLFAILLIVICIVIFYFNSYIKQHPFYIIYKKHSLIIRDRSGKLVHFRSKCIFKPNYPYICRVRSAVSTDGSIGNFSGTICNSTNIDCTVSTFSSDKKFLIVEQLFSKDLEVYKKYTSILEFDFIDSYTKDQEYHIFRMESYQRKFSFSIVFPSGRHPTSIECAHDTKGDKVPLPQDALKPTASIDANGYKEYKWEIIHPRAGDTYRVDWAW